MIPLRLLVKLLLCHEYENDDEISNERENEDSINNLEDVEHNVIDKEHDEKENEDDAKDDYMNDKSQLQCVWLTFRTLLRLVEGRFI